MSQVPEEFSTSRAFQYIQSKGFNYKQADSTQIVLENCPYNQNNCNRTGYSHFYVVVDGSKRDGIHICHKCGKQGNLNALKLQLGDAIASLASTKALGGQTSSELEKQPDFNKLHDDLLANEDALVYLTKTRGFSLDVIKRQKLGLSTRIFKGVGHNIPALIYPYLKNGNVIFWHYRSLPPKEKAFSSPIGWDACLYNENAIQEDTKEIIMVEGEANVIAALDHGIEDIVGVPGANFKKTLWIDKLDTIEKVYILYDKDTTGQRAAQVLASKVGINKCYKIVLPDFTISDGETTKAGKDLNEWFVAGGTLDAFNKLKEEAKLFDVIGVSSTTDALDQVEAALEGKDTLAPKYLTPWAPLNKLIGFEDADIIDIVAPEKIGKTTFGMNLMEYMVSEYKEDGVIICLEMPTIRMATKWICHVTNTEDNRTKSDNPKAELIKMKTALAEARHLAKEREGTLYFCYPPHISKTDDMYNLIKDCIRRYGVRWIMVDNLQLLCDRTLKNQGHRTIHLSQISKELAGIAKDYNVQIVRILQPHRIMDGKILTTDDVDGASQIAKDCDCMITLHRNRVGEMTTKTFAEMEVGTVIEQSFDNKMSVTVGLSRYSSGGTTPLVYDGARSSVYVNSPFERTPLQELKTVMAEPVIIEP